MTQDEFNHKYREAITKAAVGVHIIMESGMMLDEINEDIETSTNMLADGIQMDRQTVRKDVMSTYYQLKSALNLLVFKQ